MAPISKARAAILARLRAADGTLTVEELAAESGQHTNTVREHLEALVLDGHATKESAPKAGRGRPAWLYRATDGAAGPVGYAALAAALARRLASTSPAPAKEGEEAGRAWARTMPPAPHQTKPPASSMARGKQARAHVVTALQQAGFGVQGNRPASELTLTTCPIVEAARENTEVVCAVHLGLVKELLNGSGLPESEAVLLPFAGPGYCTLHLPGGAARETL